MDTLAPVVGLLFAAAITPGPNNLIVLEAGARRGMTAAASAMLGVIAGSLVLLALIWSGVGAAMRAFPALPAALGVIGGLYLGWLGATLLTRRSSPAGIPDDHRTLPKSTIGIAAFQLLNPKAWILVATAATAVAGSHGVGSLAALIAIVTAFCLTLWAFAGASLGRILERPRSRRLFDLAMGGLLTVSAVGVVADAFI